MLQTGFVALPWSVRSNTAARKLDDFDDLLPKVLAAQQPKECFRHALDPIQHIFLEPNFSCALPFGKSLQSCIPSVPPVEYQKSMDAGPRNDQVTHEALTNVRLAELPSRMREFFLLPSQA